MLLKSPEFVITFPRSRKTLWRLAPATGRPALTFAPPQIEIDGKLVVLRPPKLTGTEPRTLNNGVIETVFSGLIPGRAGLVLELVLQYLPGNPVVRFRYRLRSDRTRRLTCATGKEVLEYTALSLRDFPQRREVRFSEFDESVHSFRLSELDVTERQVAACHTVMGPLLALAGHGHAAMLAYEHGSQVPDAFVQFHFEPDPRVVLQAAKGNYHHGQELGAAPWSTIWLQAAVMPGSIDDLATAYRRFVLAGLSQNLASRRPYIFYNTWCWQERNKWWHGRNYLDSMNPERIMAEIDVAHRMGIEVFVLDTGWYSKTGDWDVNRKFFPDGLKRVKEALDRRGMKMGLWFSPTQAAVSSRLMQRFPDCHMTWDGKPYGPREVWETEASYRMCLVSPYWEAFADELIRLTREVGVSYFKWDAIGQYGCNDPGHHHGTAANAPRERADRYAFELGRYMIKVVNKLCAACPEAIVDFDITENGRFVGLGFLAAGKYFLVNNGPYFGSFDHPRESPVGESWSNVLVYPGPARARICRTPLDFDKWLPSVLFLTHYLPDDPASSQTINLASLILGQNGIWGDLLTVSPEGVKRFHEVLGRYRQVRDDITAAAPVRTGIVGGSPEIHEKINPATGRGVVCIFAGAQGHYRYVTAHRAASHTWQSGGVTIAPMTDGRSELVIDFSQVKAAIVFFGVSGTL